jgi:DNA-binding NarL/FixJ family response regulator
MALQFKPDVVLLDIHMPGNGIRAARDVSAVLPQSVVVMLTQSRDESTSFDVVAGWRERLPDEGHEPRTGCRMPCAAY